MGWKGFWLLGGTCQKSSRRTNETCRAAVSLTQFWWDQRAKNLYLLLLWEISDEVRISASEEDFGSYLVCLAKGGEVELCILLIGYAAGNCTCTCTYYRSCHKTLFKPIKSRPDDSTEPPIAAVTWSNPFLCDFIVVEEIQPTSLYNVASLHWSIEINSRTAF